MHPDWVYLARPVQRDKERPRVMSYVSRQLEHLRPSLRLDIVNSPDVVLLELMNGGEAVHLLNVYNSSGCEALEHLERVLDKIPAPIEFMGGDIDRKSTRLNSSHSGESRMPSSA